MFENMGWFFPTEPQIPIDTTSRVIEKIYGTNTSAFEILVLKRKIMGPCWLQVKDAKISDKGVSGPTLTFKRSTQ